MKESLASKIDEANTKAIERILSAKCFLVDIEPARKAIPGFRDNLITHSGPPIKWESSLIVSTRVWLIPPKRPRD